MPPDPPFPDWADRRDYPVAVSDLFLTANANARAVEGLTSRIALRRRRLFEARMALAERTWREDGDDGALKQTALPLSDEYHCLLRRLIDEDVQAKGELAGAEAELADLERRLGREPFSFSIDDFFRRRKTVISLDLVDYTGDARYREENFGTTAVGELDARVARLIEAALRRSGHDPATAVLRFTGDGVSLEVDHPHRAIAFADEFFQLAHRHNAETVDPRHRWWFRFGTADGELVYRQQGGVRLEPAGGVLVTAVRLQTAALPGALFADAAFFDACDEGHRGRFHPEPVVVRGKQEGESYPARCLLLLPNAANEAEAAGRWLPT